MSAHFYKVSNAGTFSYVGFTAKNRQVQWIGCNFTHSRALSGVWTKMHLFPPVLR